MPIKAKAVDKKTAAAFDRGQFGVASSVTSAGLPKRSYYYDGERRYAEAETARSASLSSSSSSSARGLRSDNKSSPVRTPALSRGYYTGDNDGDMSDDEEVIRRARAATQALLGGGFPVKKGGSKNEGEGRRLVASTNERLEKYMRAKASVDLSARASVLSTPAPTSSSHAAMPWGTSAITEEGSAHPHSGGRRDDHHFATSLTDGDSSDGSSADVIAPATSSSAADGAVGWCTNNSEFGDLMALLEQDVRREQRDNLPQGAVCVRDAFSERGQSPCQPLSSFVDPISPQYAAPSCTFAALEDKALEQLYKDWCLQRENGDGVENSSRRSSEVFIAADHRPAAFSIAASAMHQSASASPPPEGTAMSVIGASVTSQLLPDAPFTWEELLQGEVARRNIRHTPAYSPRFTTLLSDPDAIAEQATRRLQRFLQSVECVERLVRNKRFMHSVAVFLYEHHKVFLPHHRFVATAEEAAGATFDGGGADLDLENVGHADVEHTHAEHQVYAEFGDRVSSALLSVLIHRVPGFDEAEFVETLYDTPITDVVLGESDGASGDHTVLGGPQSVLSFPAWRLLLAISGFDSFFAWMMDYIQEEYRLNHESDDGTQPIAVAGVRGLRALIRSTYNRPAPSNAVESPAVDALVGVATPRDTMQQETLPKPPNLRLFDDVSASVHPRPSSEPQNPFSTPPPPLSNTFHTPPPSSNRALPMRASFLSTASSADESLSRPLPTPPVSAAGTNRGLIRNSAPLYRTRETTHPGRDLPPITPNGDSLMMPTNGDAAAAFGESSSSTRGSATSLLMRPRERSLKQPPVVASVSLSTVSHRTPTSPARPTASKSTSKVTVQISGPSTGGRGVRAHSKSRSTSTSRSQVGIEEKPQSRRPHLKR